MKAMQLGPSEVRSAAGRPHAAPGWSIPASRRAADKAPEMPNIRINTISEPALAVADDRVLIESAIDRTQTPAPAPGVTPPSPPPPSPPTLSLSGDTYTDSGSKSQKDITFNVKVPSSLKAEDYCLVNKVMGFIKKADGTFAKAILYGTATEVNFATEQVDSVDADPVYWSTSSARRNYIATGDGFKATDSPGPHDHTYHAKEETALKFHIGVYKLADVPTTTTGTIATTPIQELPWQYSVKVDAAGAITHPAL